MFTGLTSEFAGAIPMKNWCSRFCRLALAAGAVMVLRAGPSLAQSEELPCSAFSRNVYGGWRVLSPVMLDLNGRLYSPNGRERLCRRLDAERHRDERYARPAMR
jgi:hypothetical protein